MPPFMIHGKTAAELKARSSDIEINLIAVNNQDGTLVYIVEGMGLIKGEYEGTNAGYGIAHDLMEHSFGVGNIGTIRDEVQAVGACYLTRVQFVNSTGMQNSATHQTMATDLTLLGELHILEGVPFRGDTPNFSISDRCYPDLMEVIEYARKPLFDSCSQEIQGWDEAKRITSDELECRIEEFLNKCAPVMFEGLDNLSRILRDADISEFAYHEMFFHLAEQLNPYIAYPECEGERVKIFLDFQNFCVDICPSELISVDGDIMEYEDTLLRQLRDMEITESAQEERRMQGFTVSEFTLEQVCTDHNIPFCDEDEDEDIITEIWESLQDDDLITATQKQYDFCVEFNLDQPDV